MKIKSHRKQLDVYKRQAVIRIPRISNFTDFNPFESISGVSLRYVHSVKELGNPDMIILPGTKNTMEDLLWMRQNGLEAAVLKACLLYTSRRIQRKSWRLFLENLKNLNLCAL